MWLAVFSVEELGRLVGQVSHQAATVRSGIGVRVMCEWRRGLLLILVIRRRGRRGAGRGRVGGCRFWHGERGER